MPLNLDDPGIALLYDRYRLARAEEVKHARDLAVVETQLRAVTAKRDLAFSQHYALRQAIRVLHLGIDENEFERLMADPVEA